MMVNEEMQGGVQAKEDQIADLNNRIKAEEVRSGHKADNKFKKMLLKAYHNELRFRLRQWRAILEQKDQVVQRLDNSIIKKIQKRYMRAGFIRYRDQIKKLKQTLVKVDRADGIVEKYRRMQLKIIFNAWHALKSNDQAARQKFRKVLGVYNNKHLKHFFEHWAKSLRAKK